MNQPIINDRTAQLLKQLIQRLHFIDRKSGFVGEAS
uniref:Calcineurin B-like protein 10 isoform X2 n=1 Tax=Rhizophora mucronata TaxID=61149 RepID=A0A2P2KLX6_RHIMU